MRRRTEEWKGFMAGAAGGLAATMGLSDSAYEAPFSSHIYGFASHLVYGATAELVRCGVRRGWSRFLRKLPNAEVPSAAR